jgi:hypothetical protein
MYMRGPVNVMPGGCLTFGLGFLGGFFFVLAGVGVGVGVGFGFLVLVAVGVGVAVVVGVAVAVAVAESDGDVLGVPVGVAVDHAGVGDPETRPPLASAALGAAAISAIIGPSFP